MAAIPSYRHREDCELMSVIMSGLFLPPVSPWIIIVKSKGFARLLIRKRVASDLTRLAYVVMHGIVMHYI